MSPYHYSIPNLVQAGAVVLDNMEAEADLQAAMLPFYTAADIAEARQLHTDLAAAASTQVDQYGLQKGATAILDDARDAFHADVYMPHVHLLRARYRKEPTVLARLGLDRPRVRGFAGWVRQAHYLYDNLLADAALAADVEAKGLPTADATAARDALVALAQTDSSQENRKGLAQQSTRDRDALARAFADWLAEFRDLARVALAEQPEWLERLGILHRSEDR